MSGTLFKKMAKKIVILTTVLMAAGAEAIQKAISENPEAAAADIVIIGESLAATELLKKSLEEKTNLLAVANATIAEKNNQIEAAEAINKELLAAFDTVDTSNEEAGDFRLHNFTSDSTRYGFLFPTLTLKDKTITYLDVVKDKDLQAQLIQTQSGMIYEKE